MITLYSLKVLTASSFNPMVNVVTHIHFLIIKSDFPEMQYIRYSILVKISFLGRNFNDNIIRHFAKMLNVYILNQKNLGIRKYYYQSLKSYSEFTLLTFHYLYRNSYFPRVFYLILTSYCSSPFDFLNTFLNND